jgi:hypothetical protein
VPKDACQLDFVFSNTPTGDGIYDNRGGFDYHLPIEGSSGAPLRAPACVSCGAAAARCCSHPDTLRSARLPSTHHTPSPDVARHRLAAARPHAPPRARAQPP